MHAIFIITIFPFGHVADQRWLLGGTIRILGLAAGCLVWTLTHSRLNLFIFFIAFQRRIFILVQTESIYLMLKCDSWISYKYFPLQNLYMVVLERLVLIVFVSK